MKQEILNFRFENKKDFFITSKNALAVDFIQKWPEWNNQLFFLYGSSKCGKTSLGEIWQTKSEAIILDKKKIKKIFSKDNNFNYIHENNWILDNVDIFLKKKNNDEILLNFINILLEKKNHFFL